MPSGIPKNGINTGRFKKGIHPKTEFKKGNIPATKGKKLLHLRGENACHWKGGRAKCGDGYIGIYKPEHPFCNKRGYILEHRLICEKILGRYLKKNEIPHHINGIKTDNRPENIYLFSSDNGHKKYEASNCVPELKSNLYELAQEG